MSQTNPPQPNDDWARVAPAMREPMKEFCSFLQDLAGPNLLSVTAFGAVLTPAFDSSDAGAATVMVLGRVDLDLLRRLAEHGPGLGRKRIAAPLVMTPEYISASLDSFPLELLEIHQQHATLHGTDHFAALELKAPDVRLQCEREFKRILIRLRQGLLAAAGRENLLGDLRLDVGEHLLRTLRGMLWLRGKTEALARDAIVTETQTLIGGSLAGVRAALSKTATNDWQAFRSLYDDVERLAKLANEQERMTHCE